MLEEHKLKDIKDKLGKLVEESEKSVNIINGNEAIPNCKTYELVYLVGDTDRAYGVATILHELLPEDMDIRRMWDKSYDLNASAYKGRNRFNEKCLCLNKENISTELKDVLSKYSQTIH